MNDDERCRTQQREGAASVQAKDRQELSEDLAQLHAHLRRAIASQPVGISQLARRSGLSRTTVHQALSDKESRPPTQRTLLALIKALRLNEATAEELEHLRQKATSPANGKATTHGPEAPGEWIGQWDPHDLEVHPAGIARRGARRHLSNGATAGPAAAQLSGYVGRTHDSVLADAVAHAFEGQSALVLLSGASSTGKTRACWEAVQPLAAENWLLWHPFDPTHAEAALCDLERVAPRTVVWLNEAQRYCGDERFGERIAAALHTLLTDPMRAPVLVLGTLWPEYAARYTALPKPGSPDTFARTRELLAGRIVTVPDRFDAAALDEARRLADEGDTFLANTLARVTDGQVTQDLAGAPELLRRYLGASPAARSLLHAAMDARRLGAGLNLPLTFLVQAAEDYLSDAEWDSLPEDWAERALAEVTSPVHGHLAPLRQVRPRSQQGHTRQEAATIPSSAQHVYRLADYVEQHGRHERWKLCPPESFWRAAHDCLHRDDDLIQLARAAEERWRLKWASRLYTRVAAERPKATAALVAIRTWMRDWQGAERFALTASEAGDMLPLRALVFARERSGDSAAAETLARSAAGRGEFETARRLAHRRHAKGDRTGADRLAALAGGEESEPVEVDGVRPNRRDKARDRAEAASFVELLATGVDSSVTERLARQAAERGHLLPLMLLIDLRQEAGDLAAAEDLVLAVPPEARQLPLQRLIDFREDVGDHQGAERIALATPPPSVLPSLLVQRREGAGDHEGAERLAHRAARAGDPTALAMLIDARQKSGDHDAAERCARDAPHSIRVVVTMMLAQKYGEGGEVDRAERLLQTCEDDDPNLILLAATWRSEAGDVAGAERILLEAIERRNAVAIRKLAELREQSGETEAACCLYREAADAGGATVWLSGLSKEQIRWPGNLAYPKTWLYGLEADGSPAGSWGVDISHS